MPDLSDSERLDRSRLVRSIAEENASMILITGATGNNGMEIIKLLAARGIRLRAMVRSMKGTEALGAAQGVEVVVADFDRPDTVKAALRGVSKALLVTHSTEKAESQRKEFVR